MAHRFLPMYDISGAVGESKPNVAGDVRLIQALFLELAAVGDPFLEGCTPVPETGLYTPQLGALIRDYQTSLNQDYFQFSVDGIIDPMPSHSHRVGDWDTKFAGGADSTLVAMNYRMFRIDARRHLALGDRLQLPWKPDPFVR